MCRVKWQCITKRKSYRPNHIHYHSQDHYPSRKISDTTEIFCRWLPLDRWTAVSAILTNVSHEEPSAILSRGDVVTRRARNWSLGMVSPCRRGVRRANWFAFTPQRRLSIPLCPLRAGPFLHSPFRTTSYIYLRISLFYERPRGIVHLIELPEACAAGYHARRIALLRVVGCRLDAMDVCCLLTVSSAKRQARCNPLADRLLLNDLFDVTWCYEC